VSASALEDTLSIREARRISNVSLLLIRFSDADVPHLTGKLSTRLFIREHDPLHCHFWRGRCRGGSRTAPTITYHI